jgi:hypothetical protein
MLSQGAMAVAGRDDSREKAMEAKPIPAAVRTNAPDPRDAAVGKERTMCECLLDMERLTK